MSMTHLRSAIVLAGLAVLIGCQADRDRRLYVAFTSNQVSGDAALESAALSPGGLGSIPNDVEDHLGVGGASASPYVRWEADPGAGWLSVSGFWYDDDGSGTLQNNYGDINAGTQVNTDFTLANLKVSWTADLIEDVNFAFGPGIAVDTFFVESTVRSSTREENVEVFVPIPMLMLQAAARFKDFAINAEFAGMAVDFHNADGTFWDFEAMGRYSIDDNWEVFGGYRFLSIDADGRADGRPYETDIDLNGWFVGAGYLF